MPNFSRDIYRKTSQWAPKDLFYFESAGLEWLQSARKQGGPCIVPVISVDSHSLVLEKVYSASPTADSAYTFGKELSHLHDSGASSWGCPPANYDGTCYFGPLSDPVEMPTGNWSSVADYYAQGRLLPLLNYAHQRHVVTSEDDELTYRICDNLPLLLGEAANDKPARLHGDLWNGNVMWSTQNYDESHSTSSPSQSSSSEVHAVLIDPCAHGGHREEDLAMLSLFGASYLQKIFEGYNSSHPLKKGWEDRIALWQLAPILAHCVFFGGGYCGQYRSLCRQVIRHLD